MNEGRFVPTIVQYCTQLRLCAVYCRTLAGPSFLFINSTSCGLVIEPSRAYNLVCGARTVPPHSVSPGASPRPHATPSRKEPKPGITSQLPEVESQRGLPGAACSESIQVDAGAPAGFQCAQKEVAGGADPEVDEADPCLHLQAPQLVQDRHGLLPMLPWVPCEQDRPLPVPRGLVHHRLRGTGTVHTDVLSAYNCLVGRDRGRRAPSKQKCSWASPVLDALTCTLSVVQCHGVQAVQLREGGESPWQPHLHLCGQPDGRELRAALASALCGPLQQACRRGALPREPACEPKGELRAAPPQVFCLGAQCGAPPEALCHTHVPGEGNNLHLPPLVPLPHVHAQDGPRQVRTPLAGRVPL